MAESFGTSTASNLVSKLCEYLFAPIGRQFGYVLCYMSNVEDLKNEVKKLEAVKEERVQPSVDEAMRNGKLICTDIKEWLNSVKNEANEAQKLLKQGESAKNACFRGWLPNPMVRHPIGRKVKKMTQVIRELQNETEKNKFQKVYYENPPKGIVSVDRKRNTKGDVPESSALITEDVMKTLITEDVMKAILDDKISVVGVYGLGGVGKSKLLEDVETRVRKKKLFDVVVMVEVSRNPNIKTIQGDIADALGVKLTNVETARGRADRLCRRLDARLASDCEKKILIILDNLQSKLELKDVGIPCGDDNKVRGCKLLLSSRNREVLRIGMFSDQDFRLNELDDGEARRLFERITGDIVYESKFKPFVDGVVKNCGGLPLFIISLAKRLRSGKLAAWRNALILEGSDFKSLVEQNYNDLQDKRIKSLFLIYAISDQRILLRDVLIYCLGLELFNNFNKTIEDARDRLIMDLDFLQDSSLLLDSDVTEEIRMHDIIVDVAISIASLEWKALVGREDCGFEKWSKDELRECAVISFPHVGIDELPEKLDCPNLRMFLLYENNSSLKIPQSFFESMEKLLVLDLSCLSITSLPSSTQFLKNLKSLCLDFCDLVDVTDLRMLKALQFLSLTESTITRLPKEIGELIELRFLDLTGCTRLKVIEPGMLGSLTNLEELYMKNSFDKWEAEDEESRSNASLTELKNMNKLSTLDIAIPHSSYLSRDLPFGKLNKHKIQIGGVWDWSGEYKEFRTLKLELDSSDLLIEEWVLNWLQKTQDLHLDGLPHGVDSIHNLCIEGFQELKHLHVRNSPSFENVVCSIENVECTTFIGLESLFLENLNNLREICRGYLALESFSKLKSLKVDNCGEIKHLFPFSMKRIILQLEEIEISSCHLMQQIVADAEVDEDRDEINDDTKMKSCNLRRLTLRNLPKMMSFYKTGDDSVDFFDGLQILFPSLEELTVVSCGLMKIWHNKLSKESFHKLASITIQDCENLHHIFPLDIIEVFQSLKTIEVVNCPSLKSLMEHAVVNTKKRPQRLVFLNLKEVKLWDLPTLDALVTRSSQATISLPNLTTVSLRNCHSLRYLFTYDTFGTLDKLKMLDVSNCNEMQEVVAMEESEKRKLKAMKFSRLQTLKLCSLKSLISFSSGSCVFEFPSLTNLSILECTKLESFILRLLVPRVETTNEGTTDSNESPHSLFDDKVLFPSLEELTVVSCGLMRIWHKELYEESFRKLASINIQDCENLSHIFTSNIIEMFQSLKMIEVVNCTSLESLMEHVAVNTKKKPKSLVFLNLKEVKLWDLPRLDALVTSRSQATLSLPSLTTINLRNCHNLRYLFTYDTSRTLDKLEMLDVFDCNKMQEVVAIEESEEQKSKAMKFSRLHTLKICSLKSLISFSSGSCAFEFPSLRNLSILECTKLKAFILRQLAPRVETMNEGPVASDESPHSLFDEKVLFPSLEELKLLSMCQLKRIWHNQLHGQSFCKLASLTVELCENLSHVFPSNSMDRLQSLSKIEVVGCPSLEALFEPVSLSSEERQKPLELSALKEMKLLNLPRLTDILKGDYEVTLTFPSLMELNVRPCHSLSYLFSSTTAKTLHELVVLDISCCNNMRDIIVTEEGKGKTIETFEFRHLTKLKLGDLKSLICFSSENCAGDGLYPLFDEKLAFPKLEELHIKGVQQEELWTNKIPVESFCCLKVLKVKQCHNLMNVIPSFMSERLLHYMKSLTVEECPRLRNLFTVFMAKSLGQLQYLGLGGCGEMEYIVAKQEEKLEEATDNIVIPQLVTLYLQNMPKLRSFYQDKHISEWPSLKEFTIKDCKAVKVILGNASCRKLEGSGPTHQPFLLVEKVEFPALESMKILHMDNMEKIWLNDLDSNAFGKLKTLVLEHCGKLLSIFSSYNMLTRFQNLEKITVTDCGSLEVAFQVQEFEFSKTCSTNSFQLGEIVLMRLSKMKHVWNGLPQGGLTFGCLQHMEVVKCESLKSLFPSSVAKNMTQFKELLVSDCGVEEIIVNKDGVGMSASDIFFPQLTDLTLLELPKLGSFYRNSHTSAWPLLKQLQVRHCGKMRSFLFASEFQGCQGTTTSENQSTLFSFEKVIPHLEGLTLSREDIAMITQHYVFHNLKELVLACYHDENVTFPSNFLLHGFPNLEVFGVICSSFEEIFPEDSSRHGGATFCGESTIMENPPKALQNLRQLRLHKLCNLKRVWKDGSLMAGILKQIESLCVKECPSLSIVLPSPTSFQRLTGLGVHDCAGLVCMGTCSAVTNLVHLTWLFLNNCVAMEDVVTDDGNGEEDISFPKLQRLTLDNLPSLESFSPTNCTFRFPLLVCIIVIKCPKMNIFCKGALRTPNLDKVLLSYMGDEWHWEGDLNTTIQTLSA